QIVDSNAAYGKRGKRDFGGDLAEKIEAGEVVEVFGCGGEGGAAADIAGAFLLGAAGLVEVVGGNANDHSRADDAANVANFRLFLAGVHAVGPRAHGRCRG